MNKLFTGIATIALVGAVVAGATVAFYNDTETSTGNVFTAGSIDLKVDHLKQIYNDVECKTCDVLIDSDTSTQVVEKDGVSVSPYDAYEAPKPGSWVDEFNDAHWIWGEEGQPDGSDRTEYRFRDTFTWYGPISGVTLDFSLSGDDNYTVYLNGTQIAQNDSDAVWQNLHSVSGFENEINQGVNTIEFVVKNTGGYWAGLIYEMTIDGNCEDDYFKNHCSLFGEKDLGENDQFFMFDDVKPGDLGINVISLHVYDNDAYACLITHDETNNENGLQESEGDDTDAEGELQNYLELFVWQDDNYNGKWDYTTELDFGTSTISNLGTVPVFAGENNYLSATSTAYVGIAWCAGDIEVSESTGDITCDGHGMENDAQSDIYSASLTAYAEQVRNNTGFQCSPELLID